MDANEKIDIPRQMLWYNSRLQRVCAEYYLSRVLNSRISTIANSQLIEQQKMVLNISIHHTQNIASITISSGRMPSTVVVIRYLKVPENSVNIKCVQNFAQANSNPMLK